MQAYYPSSAAHSHSTIPVNPIISMQAYHPSTAAHTHLNITTIPTNDTPPPSPTASEIIASLQDPENLSDEELLKRALTAQAALAKWQNEYLKNDKRIRMATTGLSNSRDQPRARQLQDPKDFERQRNAAEDKANTAPKPTQTTSSRGRILKKTTNASSSAPPKQPKAVPNKPKTTASKGPKPTKAPIPSPSQPAKPTSKVPTPPKPTPSTSSKPAPPTALIPKDLLIDMNAPQPAETVGKRTRQPKKMFDYSAPAPAPKKATEKRARSPSPAAAPAAKKRATPAAAAKSEARSASMTATWARRRAQGTNGRHGGAPKASTVAKARAKKGGM